MVQYTEVLTAKADNLITEIHREGQKRNLQSVFVWESAPLNPQWKHRIDSYSMSSDLKQQLCQEHCPTSTSLTVTQKIKRFKKVCNISWFYKVQKYIIIFLKVFVLVYLLIYSFMSRKYLRKEEYLLKHEYNSLPNTILLCVLCSQRTLFVPLVEMPRCFLSPYKCSLAIGIETVCVICTADDSDEKYPTL